ncbi:branched-chain amino acid ABC transporter permease [Enemella sp. A6]|uniref:branched-chain amino acid ABC transporter permease n=1 Tax=Enemella sp. A6 TaxID=3440152 RepID=UPI003EBE920F
MNIVQSIIDALSQGALYGLGALGIGLVFGVMRLANFAHGELITAGAYTMVLTWGPYGPVVAVLLTGVVCVVLAVLMQLVVFRWLRGAGAATLLIASFGLSFLLQKVYENIFGNNVRAAPVGGPLATYMDIGGLRVQYLTLVTIVATAVLLVLLHLFLNRSAWGLHVQAASSDFRTARLLGVRAGRVIALTFGIAGVLGAVVAFVLTVQRGAVDPGFGVSFTVLALIGAVIGGIDKLWGALVGGFVVGFVLSQLSTWLPQGISEYRNAFVFALVIAILLFKPNGLLQARNAAERA